MPLSLLCGLGWWRAAEPDRGWSVVSGAGVTGLFGWVLVVPVAFDDAGVGAVASGRVQPAATCEVRLDCL
jgi:hypothetical protein